MADSVSMDEKQKRESDIAQWLTQFSRLYKEEFGEAVQYQEESAKLINTWYWETLNETIRPRMALNNGNKTKVDQQCPVRRLSHFFQRGNLVSLRTDL